MSTVASTAIQDRTEEFLLVRFMRETARLVSQNVSEATKKEYTSKFKRMIGTGFLPEQSNARRTFYSYRAALLYGTANEVVQALRVRDKAVYRSQEWAAAMQILERSAQIFERYPPDPLRQHYRSGSTSFTWSTLKKGTRDDASMSFTSRSKKKVLSKLRKIANWREQLIAHTTDKHKLSAALIAITGCRPSEVAQGALVKLEYTRNGELVLVVTVKGTKVTKTSGQPERTLLIRITDPVTRLLANEVMNSSNGLLLVSTSPANLTAALIKAGRRAFPELRDSVSPFVLRHAFAADCKRAGFDAICIAKLLGHRVTETQQYYGYAVCASGRSPLLAVKATLPVRDTRRSPQMALAKVCSPGLGRP